MDFVLRATGWKDKTKIQQKIEEVLSKVNMQKKGHKFPYELSGGEQQRICIARAILNNPVLLLADEPTGALDSKMTVEIMELLKELNRGGMTVIVVTHEPDVAAYANRVVVFKDGKIIEIQVNRPSVEKTESLS